MIELEEFKEYYKTHNQKECSEKFNVSMRYIRKYVKENKIIKEHNWSPLANSIAYNNGNEVIYIKDGDIIPEGFVKGGIATRTHDQYINDGIKSKNTQEINREENNKKIIENYGSLKNYYTHRYNKSEEGIIEKYGSKDNFYKIGTQTRFNNIIKEYGSVENYNNEISKKCHNWWMTSMTPDERKEWIKTSLEHGAGWNPEKSLSNNSKPNQEFKKILEEYNINFSKEYNKIPNYRYDFFVDRKNILIEINPSSTHNSTIGFMKREPIDNKYHYNKTKAANESGLRCIHVWDWDDPNKIINMLYDREVIYGRKCTIKEVDKEEAKEFINKYHFQNYSRDSIRIGLYYNNELVSIMTFGKSRYNKNYQYELIRYCSSKSVIGGSKKIFDYFVTTYKPSSIISYCDMSKFSGTTYDDLGFNLVKWNKPSKHWYNIREEKHITDNLLRQLGADKLLGTNYGKGSSNEKIMLENGYVVIYDCGQATYGWIPE